MSENISKAIPNDRKGKKKNAPLRRTEPSDSQELPAAPKLSENFEPFFMDFAPKQQRVCGSCKCSILFNMPPPDNIVLVVNDLFFLCPTFRMVRLGVRLQCRRRCGTHITISTRIACTRTFVGLTSMAPPSPSHRVCSSTVRRYAAFHTLPLREKRL